MYFQERYFGKIAVYPSWCFRVELSNKFAILYYIRREYLTKNWIGVTILFLLLSTGLKVSVFTSGATRGGRARLPPPPSPAYHDPPALFKANTHFGRRLRRDNYEHVI